MEAAKTYIQIQLQVPLYHLCTDFITRAHAHISFIHSHNTSIHGLFVLNTNLKRSTVE